jgi:hypothetical protein
MLGSDEMIHGMRAAMPSNKQITDMRGVYVVAAELAKHGFIASRTSRSGAGRREGRALTGVRRAVRRIARRSFKIPNAT